LKYRVTCTLIFVFAQSIFNLHCASSKEKFNVKKRLSMLSFNLKGWQYKKGDYKETIEFLKGVDFDLILLQEFTPFFKRRLFFLNKKYKYKRFYPSRGPYGYGLYSKNRILQTKYIKGFRRGTSAQCVKILVGKRKRLHVCNVHLKSPKSSLKMKLSIFKKLKKNENIRRKEWNAVLKWCNSRKKRMGCIISGDFNTLATSGLFGEMVNGDMDDAMDIARTIPGNTFPKTFLPFGIMRIDFILINKVLKVIDARTLNKGGSDHFPIRATFSI